MSRLAGVYKTTNYVYDAVFVGFITGKYIIWHNRLNWKYSHKTMMSKA